MTIVLSLREARRLEQEIEQKSNRLMPRHASCSVSIHENFDDVLQAWEVEQQSNISRIEALNKIRASIRSMIQNQHAMLLTDQLSVGPFNTMNGLMARRAELENLIFKISTLANQQPAKKNEIDVQRSKHAALLRIANGTDEMAKTSSADSVQINALSENFSKSLKTLVANSNQELRKITDKLGAANSAVTITIYGFDEEVLKEEDLIP